MSDAPDAHDEEPIYADPRARNHALHLAMWIFLGSETLLFAGLFGLYAAYRAEYTVDFVAAVAHNDEVIGTVNTVVLIVSSFFVAWGIHAMRAGRDRRCVTALAIALGLGLLFLVFKSIEYRHHFAEGIVPGEGYASAALPSFGAHMFFNLYYTMTGLHALHVIAGMVILGWLIVRVRRRRATREHHPELELGGLYWHLVDVVWIFLWPLLYLTR